MATGIASTFRRGPGDVGTLSGSKLIRDHIDQALGTRAGDRTQPGELPWLGSFGSRVDRFRHLPINDQTRDLVFATVVESLKRWVPSIQVVGVSVGQENDAMRVTVDYREITTGEVGQTEVSV